MTEERRQQPDRRSGPRRAGGRRSTDWSWTIRRLSEWTGMSRDFFMGELRDGQLQAGKFGREYRIHIHEVRRYLAARGYPVPPAPVAVPTPFEVK